MTLRLTLCLSLIVLAACSVPKRDPNTPRNYISVHSSKLGVNTFAVAYYHKDVATELIFWGLYPKALIWVPGSYTAVDYVFALGKPNVMATTAVGLVIPKSSACASKLLRAKRGQRLSVKGGAGPPKRAIGSIIVVDRCELGEVAAPKGTAASQGNTK